MPHIPGAGRALQLRMHPSSNAGRIVRNLSLCFLRQVSLFPVCCYFSDLCGSGDLHQTNNDSFAGRSVDLAAGERAEMVYALHTDSGHCRLNSSSLAAVLNGWRFLVEHRFMKCLHQKNEKNWVSRPVSHRAIKDYGGHFPMQAIIVAYQTSVEAITREVVP